MILLSSATLDQYDRNMLQADIGITFQEAWYQVPKHRWYWQYDRDYVHSIFGLMTFVEASRKTFNQKLVITVFSPLDRWINVNSPVYKVADIVLLYDCDYTVIMNDINPLNERRRYGTNVMSMLIEDYIIRKERIS